MALSHIALLALLASGDVKLPSTLTADQLQQPQGAAPVLMLVSTTPQKNAAPPNAIKKKKKMKKKVPLDKIL